MIQLINIIYLYIAMVATVYWHELGHHGKKIHIEKWFPWVEGWSESTEGWFGIIPARYGGLIFNAAAFLAIYYLKPEFILFLLFGFMNWLHFVLYSIFGSFNKELSQSYVRYLERYRPSMLSNFVFDDVPNTRRYLFVPLGIVAFLLFYKFYLPIIISIFI